MNILALNCLSLDYPSHCWSSSMYSELKHRYSVSVTASSAARLSLDLFFVCAFCDPEYFHMSQSSHN